MPRLPLWPLLTPTPVQLRHKVSELRDQLLLQLGLVVFQVANHPDVALETLAVARQMQVQLGRLALAAVRQRDRTFAYEMNRLHLAWFEHRSQRRCYCASKNAHDVEVVSGARHD